MEFQKSLTKIICRLCKEEFKDPTSLYKHLQQKHDAGPALKNHRTCSICGVQCVKNESYKEHMLHIHGLRTEPQKLTFKSLNDFLLWKVELENKYSCQYVLQSAPKLLPSNERKYFYQCDRAGQDRPKSREKKITTITKKSCPSVILVLEGTGILKVEYWDKHVGHSKNFESGHGDELTSAISTLEMMQNMDSRDFDDSLTENFAYNTDFDYSPSVTKSRKRSPRKRGKTTTSNLTSSQNVIRTFYSPSNSGVPPKKPKSSIHFSLASVACGKINKNIISEKKVINPPSLETVSSKSSSSSSVNNKLSTVNTSKNDTVVASTSKVGAPSASSSTTCVTTTTSALPVVSSSKVSVSVTSSLSTEQTAASSSVDEVVPINEAAALSSPVHNDSSSAFSDIRASSPIDDIDTSSPVDEIDKPLPNNQTTSINEVLSSSSVSETESSAEPSTNKKETSPSKTVNSAQLSTTVSVSSSTTSATEQVSLSKNATKATSLNKITKTTSSNEVTKATSSVKNVTKTSSPSFSSITTKSSMPSSVKTSSPSVTNVTGSPITNLVNLVQTSTSLGPNFKNTATPLILSNSSPNQFYVLGPAIGTQSNFGSNLSNLILCPTGQNIITSNTIVNPNVPTSILKNSEENRKRKAETESLSPDVKKKVSAQEAAKSPAFNSISTAASVPYSIGGSQLLTNYIGSTPSSVACMSSNANNKIVLSSLPPMSFVNINNQLIPINTAGAPFSLSSASVPIGQPPVAFNLSTTSVLKNSIGSENVASSCSTSRPLNSISVLSSTPISKPTVKVYNPNVVREGESNPSRPLSSSTPFSKSSTTVTPPTSSTKAVTPSESNLNVEHGYSFAKKKLVRTKLESISNVSTPKKSKAGTPEASLTVSPINRNDQSVIARTVSCVVQENASTNSFFGLNNTNRTFSKVISVASQIAQTVASSKNLPPSISNVPKASAKAESKRSVSKAKKGTNVPSIVIPSIPNDSKHSFVFESAGDVYMLQPVQNDESKTGEHNLPELIKVKNKAISVQTVPSGKYSYSNNSSKSSISPEKMNLKDDSEILKKVKYYQLEMKYLSSQEECKRLKVDLAKSKLKNKELSEKSGTEMQPSISTTHVDNQTESCIQAEELIKAFEKRCESDQDSNIYTLVRTSVLRSLYEDIQELSATNKQQYKELKSYRDHDTFYKFLTQELEDEK